MFSEPFSRLSGSYDDHKIVQLRPLNLLLLLLEGQHLERDHKGCFGREWRHQKEISASWHHVERKLMLSVSKLRLKS